MTDKHKPAESSSSRCPICGKPVEPARETFPFCNQRCRQIDLGRWLDGRYVISRPVAESDLDEGT